MKIIISLLFALLFLWRDVLFAQKPTTTIQQDATKGTAKDNFLYGAWRLARDEYLALLKKDSTNAMYNYRTGICYLQLFEDRDKAVFYLERALRYKTTEKDAPFMLAKAYHLDYKFDEAIQKYNEAISSSTDLELISRAKLYIDMCHTAKKMIQNPVKNIVIQNLGTHVNSPEPDYYPFLKDDYSELYFTTRRSKGNPGYLTWDGLFTADIFHTTDKDGEWTKAKSLGGVLSTSNDEEIVGLTPDGDAILINFFDFKIKDDIQLAEKVNKQFKKPESIPDPVSLSSSQEISGCLTPDKQGLYFASDRVDGKGGLDIYFSKRLPTGGWGVPTNVAELNTAFDDAFPHILRGGETMYFSSEGHGAMGGYDIFKCQWDTTTKTWTKIQNIGYPLNTPENDYNITFDNTGRHGYISTFRKEDSMGDVDIYEVTFLDVEPRVSTVITQLYYLAPIDYKNYQTFITCEKDGVKKKFVPEYLPDTSQWKVIDRKTETIKEGMEYKTFVTLEKNKVSKTYPLDKLPHDHHSYTFVNIDSKLLPIKDFKLQNMPQTTKVYINQGTFVVYDQQHQKKQGEFIVAPKNKRAIMALYEGKHKATIQAEGFKDVVTEIVVPGKNSYQYKFEQEFELVPLQKPAPVQYLSLPK